MKWALSLLFPVLAFGQPFTFNDPAFVAGSATVASAPAFTPTNISGYPSVAWYTMATNGIYTTNSTLDLGLTSRVTWKDLFTNAWDLTNIYTLGAPVAGLERNFPARVPASLNGMDTLRFTNDTVALSQTYLHSLIYTASQPHTVVFVMNPRHVTGVAETLMDNVAAPRQLFRISGDKWQANAGTSLTGFIVATQKWQVIACVFTNGGSTIYTNFAGTTNGNTGITFLNGLTVGNGNTLAAPITCDMAEVCTYATNLPFSVYSNIVVYEQTKWGSANF